MTPSSHAVLLIDDSHEDLFLAKRLLSRAGVKQPIVTIDDSQEAIVYLRACLTPGAAALKPSAIFCDIRMPVQNGFDVLKWFRAHRALADIPFFMLSGGNVEADRKRALAMGAAGYLHKFPSVEELRKALREANLI